MQRGKKYNTASTESNRVAESYVILQWQMKNVFDHVLNVYFYFPRF